MEIGLILKDIRDKFVKENFFRIERFIREQVILDGQFAFYDIAIDRAITEYKIPHRRTFVPIDIIDLAVEGDHNYYFLHEKFDRTHMVVTTTGPTKLRFLAGRFPRDGYAGNRETFTTVPPGTGPKGDTGATGAAGPAGNVIEDKACDASVSVGDWVRIDSGTGDAIKAQANNFTNSRVIGVCVAKGSPNEADIVTHGPTPAVFAGLSLNAAYFLDEVTSGAQTLVPPVLTDEVVTPLGYACSTTEMIVRIDEGIEIDTT